MEACVKCGIPHPRNNTLIDTLVEIVMDTWATVEGKDTAQLRSKDATPTSLLSKVHIFDEDMAILLTHLINV